MGVLEGVLDATRGSWACWYSGKTLIEGCVDSEWDIWWVR